MEKKSTYVRTWILKENNIVMPNTYNRWNLVVPNDTYVVKILSKILEEYDCQLYQIYKNPKFTVLELDISPKYNDLAKNKCETLLSSLNLNILSHAECAEFYGTIFVRQDSIPGVSIGTDYVEKKFSTKKEAEKADEKCLTTLVVGLVDSTSSAKVEMHEKVPILG